VFNDHPWASADFFPGEGKIFQGAKTYYLPKKMLFFSLNVKKKTLLCPAKGGKSPLLPSSTDAHVTTLGSPNLWALLKFKKITAIKHDFEFTFVYMSTLSIPKKISPNFSNF